MRYAKAPDRESALLLLREIAARHVPFAPRSVDRPLVLYGAGSLGRMARDYFDRLGIPILHVVDARPDAPRRDPFWAGVEILGLEDVPADQRAASLLAVCVATTPFSELAGQLERQGWLDVVPFYDIAEAYRDRHPLSNGWHSGPLSSEDIGGIGSVLTRWEDDVSRAHHLQFVAWRSLREEWVFDDAPMATHDRYLIPQVLSVLHDHEVLVDVGAHHGAVIERFIEAMGDRFDAIYAIEPDPENLSSLHGQISQHAGEPGGRIQVLEVALGAESSEQPFFDGLGYASQRSELGRRTVNFMPLDRLGISPTFIKVHTEGSELDVLAGGLATIREHRPLVAATIYHSRQGLWRSPQWLMNELEDCVFLLRVDSWLGTGCVMYAIPRERLDDGGVPGHPAIAQE